MALDEALLGRAARTGEAVFRVYTWARPTLSLGRNQTARGVYDPERARALGVEVVRRPTGGRAVLHWREVTYSVAAPVAPGEPLRESYARINRLLLDGLRRLGVGATLARPGARAPLPGAAPCFETPTEGELVVDSRKLVGSAQYREPGALLQHGSILLDDDQSILERLALNPIPSSRAGGPSSPATLHQVLGRVPAVAEVADALFAAVRAIEDGGARPLDAIPSLDADVRRAAERYRDDQWTWRR
jgi:lipoate-protein ligase A